MGRKISIIGSGNVATNLAHAFDRAGHDILQVISANSERAKQLANCFGAYYGNSISSVDFNADFIIINSSTQWRVDGVLMLAMVGKN